MQSWSKSALITILPPKSASPSPALWMTPAIASEYDGRASARVSAPDAEEGATGADRRAANCGPVRRATCAFVVLVPRRSVAAGGARGAGRRAWLSGARAHRPRRRVRLAGVRARSETLRRTSHHRGGADAGGPVSRHAARRDPEGIREPLPAAHGGARAHEACRQGIAAAG